MVTEILNKKQVLIPFGKKYRAFYGFEKLIFEDICLGTRPTLHT